MWSSVSCMDSSETILMATITTASFVPNAMRSQARISPYLTMCQTIGRELRSGGSNTREMAPHNASLFQVKGACLHKNLSSLQIEIYFCFVSVSRF